MAKRISELAITTSVSDSDYIPCVQGGVTKRATRAALYPDDVPVDTSSRILDLTGDRAPAIPDDPAGVTYLQDAWATTDGWASAWASSVTLAAETTQLKLTGNGGNSYVAIHKTGNSLGKHHVVKAKINRSVTQIGYYNGAIIQYSAPVIVGGYMYGYFYTLGSNTTNYSIFFDFGRTTTASDTVEVLSIYIGTGAYLSKLVDRAGVPWTNYGALPVDGPFGKGLQFNGAQYLQAPGPMIGATGTIVVKVKFDSTAPATNGVLFNNRNATARQGIQLTQETTTGQIRIFICDVSNFQSVLIRATTPDTTNVHTIKIRFTSTTSVTTQFNDEAEKVTAITVGDYLSISTLLAGARDASNDFFTGTIYALRADSRVWTDDEIARWSRDPYSEDSGLVDAFSLDFTNLPTFADNAAAIAGNLPAGKLYKTSTGNVLVRY